MVVPKPKKEPVPPRADPFAVARADQKMGAYSRVRICTECYKEEEIRADNPAMRCRSCANAKSGRKGALSRWGNHERSKIACLNCGQKYYRRPSETGKFCSRTCSAEFKTTQPGRSAAALWRSARREALRRNPFCAICGTFRKLDVHHIIPYRLTQDNSQWNLIPLCRRHHCQVERIFLALEPFDGHRPDLLILRRTELIERQSITRFRLKLIWEQINAEAA